MDDVEPSSLPQAGPPGQPDIPDKLYFRIGEVSRLVGVKPFVLRYWETEFPMLSPKKSGTGQRLYRRRDVELLLRIRELLHDRRFTIEGARKLLAEPSPARLKPAVTLASIRRELQAILDLLR